MHTENRFEINLDISPFDPNAHHDFPAAAFARSGFPHPLRSLDAASHRRDRRHPSRPSFRYQPGFR